jgi:hypothetical protein
MGASSRCVCFSKEVFHGAHNALLDLEELEEKSLDAFKRKYQALSEQARRQLILGELDTGTPEP